MIPLYPEAFCAVTHIISTHLVISLFCKRFWAFSYMAQHFVRPVVRTHEALMYI
jgi:hypothetical protein